LIFSHFRTGSPENIAGLPALQNMGSKLKKKFSGRYENKSISRTSKRHKQIIFDKLRENIRTKAVARARELNLFR